MKMMSVEASTYEGLMERLGAEYERMLERWESGGLFWHFQVYLKKYAKSGWVKHASRHYKKPVCAVLALARLGLPITGPALNHLTKIDRDVCWSRLVYLASYGVLEPVEPVERRGSIARVRGYKITPGFLSHVYKTLQELETQEG